MSHFTAEELHDQLAAAVRLFNRTKDSGDGSTAGYWLNAYHDIWDELEARGTSMTVHLPRLFAEGAWSNRHLVNPIWWPKVGVQWNRARVGFEEPRRS